MRSNTLDLVRIARHDSADRPTEAAAIMDEAAPDFEYVARTSGGVNLKALVPEFTAYEDDPNEDREFPYDAPIARPMTIEEARGTRIAAARQWRRIDWGKWVDTRGALTVTVPTGFPVGQRLVDGDGRHYEVTAPGVARSVPEGHAAGIRDIDWQALGLPPPDHTWTFGQSNGSSNHAFERIDGRTRMYGDDVRAAHERYRGGLREYRDQTTQRFAIREDLAAAVLALEMATAIPLDVAATRRDFGLDEP